MTEEQMRIVATGCVVLLTGCGIYMILESVTTSHELREAAVDIKRANGYLVRAAAQRKHFWQR